MNLSSIPGRQQTRPDPEVGLPELVSRLAEDTGEVIRAEIGVHKARALGTVGRVKNAAVFFAAAGVLALAALIALLVGLIMALTPLIGPGFSTIAVIGTVLVIAIALAVVGKGKLTAGKAGS